LAVSATHKISDKFGRYILLERLGKGGMGEVYLAKLAGPMGVTRYVALKRVLEGMTSEKVAQMFVDEMRLAVRLTHPNIVSVYDFGLEQDSYFLAMEFIEGCDVHQVLKRSHAKGAANIECDLFMIAQVARGLDYAHKLSDAKGSPLEIVHRDVTPANIMISYNGDVKLADFGIARAAQQVRQTVTEAGEIKGKIRYMSPEQARGERIDGRSDLFSLGTVLLELLTLRPAFAAESDIASLVQVQGGIPADWEARKAKIPADVLPVIEGAMSKEKDTRFKDGAAFAEACEIALRKRDPGFGPHKLAAYIETLFAKEHTALKERMHKYESVQDPSPSGPAPQAGGNADDDKGTAMTRPDSIISGEQVSGAIPIGGTRVSGTTMVAPKASRGLLYGGAVGGLALAFFGVAAVVRNNHPAGTAGATPSAAMVSPTTTGPAPQVQPAAPTPGPSPSAVPPPVAPPPPVAAQRTGRLLLTTNTLATRVFLDKSPLEKSQTPVAAGGMSFKVDVPAGVDWMLRIEAEGFSPVSLPLHLLAGEETTLPVLLSPLAAMVAPPPPSAARPAAHPGGVRRAAAPAAPGAAPAAPAPRPAKAPSSAQGGIEDPFN
jgi:serine/threonine protein kinase